MLFMPSRGLRMQHTMRQRNASGSMDASRSGQAGRHFARGARYLGSSEARPPARFRAYSHANKLWVETGATPPSAHLSPSPPWAQDGMGADYKVDSGGSLPQYVQERARAGGEQHRQSLSIDDMARWRQYQMQHQLWVETGATPPAHAPSLLPHRLPPRVDAHPPHRLHRPREPLNASLGLSRTHSPPHAASAQPSLPSTASSSM